MVFRYRCTIERLVKEFFIDDAGYESTSFFTPDSQERI